MNLGQQSEQQHVPATGAAPEVRKRPIVSGISVLAAMVVFLVGILVEFFLVQMEVEKSYQLVVQPSTSVATTWDPQDPPLTTTMWNIISNERAMRATKDALALSRQETVAAREDAASVREEAVEEMKGVPITEQATRRGGTETHKATIAEDAWVRMAVKLQIPKEDAVAGQGRAIAVKNPTTEKTSENAEIAREFEIAKHETAKKTAELETSKEEAANATTRAADAAGAETRALMAQMAYLEKQRIALTTEKDNLARELETAKDEAATKEAELKTSKAAADAAARADVAAEAETRALMVQVADLNKKRTALRTENDKLARELETAKNETAQKAAELETSKAAVDATARAAGAAEAEMQAWMAQVADLDKKRVALTTENDNLEAGAILARATADSFATASTRLAELEALGERHRIQEAEHEANTLILTREFDTYREAHMVSDRRYHHDIAAMNVVIDDFRVQLGKLQAKEAAAAEVATRVAEAQKKQAIGGGGGGGGYDHERGGMAPEEGTWRAARGAAPPRAGGGGGYGDRDGGRMGGGGGMGGGGFDRRDEGRGGGGRDGERPSFGRRNDGDSSAGGSGGGFGGARGMEREPFQPPAPPAGNAFAKRFGSNFDRDSDRSYPRPNAGGMGGGGGGGGFDRRDDDWRGGMGGGGFDRRDDDRRGSSGSGGGFDGGRMGGGGGYDRQDERRAGGGGGGFDRRDEGRGGGGGGMGMGNSRFSRDNNYDGGSGGGGGAYRRPGAGSPEARLSPPSRPSAGGGGFGGRSGGSSTSPPASLSKMSIKEPKEAVKEVAAAPEPKEPEAEPTPEPEPVPEEPKEDPAEVARASAAEALEAGKRGKDLKEFVLAQEKRTTAGALLAAALEGTTTPEDMKWMGKDEFGPALRALSAKDSTQQQMGMIYAVVAKCHQMGFPKAAGGAVVQTMFMGMYNDDLVEEEAFIEWKDDVDNTAEGRMKAVMQTTPWFVWLEIVDDEEDEDED